MVHLYNAASHMSPEWHCASQVRRSV